MYKILILFIFFVDVCHGQVLSNEGRAHYKAAMILFEIANSVSDYKEVAAEFEKVSSSDPNYADTYINLCKIYGRIGVEQGEEYFKKAINALETYKRLNPNDQTSYDDELIILDALKRKAKTKMIDGYIGHWNWNGLVITKTNEKWTAHITKDPKVGEYSQVLNITQQEDYLILEISHHKDGKARGDLGQGRYYIHHKNHNIYFTEEFSFDKYKMWHEGNDVYISIISSYSDYYYNGRKVYTDPVWNNQYWNDKSWKFKIERVY